MEKLYGFTGLSKVCDITFVLLHETWLKNDF